MSGFPTRPSLTAFGPRRSNARPVRNPQQQAGADFMNLLRWDVAGLGASCPRAWVLATFTGPTTIAVTAQGNAWHGAAPTPARSGTGVYTFTYAATYVDDDSVAIVTNLLAVKVSPRGSTARISGWEITDSRIVTVYLFDAAGAAADGSFTFELF